MSVTSIRLNNEIEAPLEQLAAKLDKSKNNIINQAIREFISRHVMEESRWLDTLQALESVKSGRLIDEKEVFEGLQSWGTENEKSPPKP